MKWLRGTLQELRKYPTAMVGLVVIFALILISAYALITIPYSEAIRLWRGGEEVVRDYPKNARPVWTNYFTRTKLARSYILDSRDEDGEAIVRVTEPESSFAQKEETIIFSIDFEYDTFPQELILYLNGRFSEKQPHVSVTWETPDGREIRIGELSAGRNETYRFNTDQRLERRLRGVKPEIGLFAVPDSDPAVPLEGPYKLKVNALLFDAGDEIDARFVIYGQVYGLAGTDHRRRDLMVPLLWGTPVALAFGLLAAVGSTLTTMIIAAVGVWYGGAIDGAIQRITEVNLILPVLPILIMIGTFYSRSIWVILGVVILLGIFGAGIKTFRAIFLQVKESPYIEAAQSYGAGSGRIIMVYLVPRIVPLLIPQLVVLIPGFVFLEASLTVLGLGDPVLPTWGKIINDANNQGALFNGYYYWVLQPAALLMLTGLGFSMVGFALDRIFNPRLRGV